MGADGLPESAVVSLAYDDVKFTVKVKPIGHGPLRLVAPDGRVDNFTRCWAELETSDGRRGVGWLEWNHNQNRSEQSILPLA